MMPTATLGQLVTLRSQLEIGLEAYLRDVAALTAWPAPEIAGGVARLDHLYQAPDVQPRASRRGRGGAEPGGDQDEFGRDDWSRERLAWDLVWPAIDRPVVVLGAPGQGKTLLTQKTAAAVATASLATASRESRQLADVPLPLWLRAEHLMKAGSLRGAIEMHVGAIVESALKRRVPDAATRPAALPAIEYLANAPQSRDTWLFIDSLDESEWDRHVFHQELAKLTCRIVLTRRPYGYDSSHLVFVPATDRDSEDDAADTAVVEYDLAALMPAQRDQFIAEWFADDLEAASRLVHLLRTSRRFADLLRNPHLLTLMCHVCGTARHEIVPDEIASRVQLFQSAIDTLMRRTRALRGRDAPVASLPPATADTRMVMLRQVARALFEAHPDDVSFSTAEWTERLEHAGNTTENVRSRLTNDLYASGLLVEPTPGVAKFIHRSFHEYLTAAAWVESGKLVALIRQYIDRPAFREVIAMAIAYQRLLHRGGSVDHATKTVARIIDRPPGPPGLAAVRMSEAIIDAGPNAVDDHARTAVVRALSSTLADSGSGPGSYASALVRAEAGNALGALGDPRFSRDRWWLPDESHYGFVRIPHGDFLMGESPRENDHRDGTVDEHTVAVPEFFIGRYLVTVAQFRAYVLDTAHREPTDPRSLNTVVNHPVVNISWREALDYCAWLAAALQTDRTIDETFKQALGGAWTLVPPSEPEWEKAARGTDGRPYPWGWTCEPDRANYWDTGIRAPTSVGCFPRGASPFGVLDLSGCAEEWTRSLWGRNPAQPQFVYPYTPNDGRENLSRSGHRVIRGGDFNSLPRSIRATSRSSLPTEKSPRVGLRIAVVRADTIQP